MAGCCLIGNDLEARSLAAQPRSWNIGANCVLQRATEDAGLLRPTDDEEAFLGLEECADAHGHRPLWGRHRVLPVGGCLQRRIWRQSDDTGARVDGRARLVVADVTIGADAKDGEIEAAARRERAVEGAGRRFRIRRGRRQLVDAVRIGADAAQERAPEPPSEAAGIGRGHTEVLVQAIEIDFRKIDFGASRARCQDVEHAERSAARREADRRMGFGPNNARDGIGRRFPHRAFIGYDGQFPTFCNSDHFENFAPCAGTTDRGWHHSGGRRRWQSHDPATEAREIGGLTSVTPARRIDDVLAAIENWVGPQGPPGAGAAVWSRGEIVAERYAGMAAPGVTVDADTLFPLASVTKPIAAATVMSLVDAGAVSLDEPVARLVPEFRAGPGADSAEADPELERLRPTISARQLLCHVSGLPEDLGPRESRYAEQVAIDTIIDQMCRLPLGFVPGSRLRYSNAGFGVLTRLAENVSGTSFWELAQAEILDPLGATNIVANPQGDTLDRVARLEDTVHGGTAIETYNSAYWRSLALPWGGLFGTPRDAARFAAAFLPSGDRALSPATVAAMTTDQTLGVPGGVESAKISWDPGRWGLGWEVKGEKRRHWTGELTSARTFCHFGHAGTLLWGDPEQDLALAVFVNRSVAHMWGFILPRWARLSNAVAAAASW